MTSQQERAVSIFERADSLITQIRGVRNRVQKGKHIDPSDFQQIQEVLDSLRHHCEMHNTERLSPD